MAKYTGFASVEKYDFIIGVVPIRTAIAGAAKRCETANLRVIKHSLSFTEWCGCNFEPVAWRTFSTSKDEYLRFSEIEKSTNMEFHKFERFSFNVGCTHLESRNN